MKKLIAMMMTGIVFVAYTGDVFTRDHKSKAFSRGIEGGKGKRKKGSKRMRKPKMPYEVLEEKRLFPIDLKPKFPSGLNCPGVSSPFGLKTRYDGSRRNNPFYNFHNGMDISLEIGTPLLAVAD